MPSRDLHELLNLLAQALVDQPSLPASLIQALREADEGAIQSSAINIGGDIITATGGSVVVNRSAGAQVVIYRPDAATLVSAILQIREQMADEQLTGSRQRITEYLAAVRNYCVNLPYLSLHGLLQRAGSEGTFSLRQSYIDVHVRQLRDINESGGDWELDLQIEEAIIRNDAREFSRLQTERERRKKEGNLKSRPARAEERQHWQERMSQTVDAQDATAFLRMKRYLEWAPMTVAEMMQQHSLLLILGEGGAGKSTLLRHLVEYAWDAPEQIGLDKPHLPLLIPLRQLARADGSLEDRLNQVLTSELVLMQKLPDGFFTDWSAQTSAPWLVLLDALDEVSADERTRLVQWLTGVLRNIGYHRVVITSRPPGYMSGEFGELFYHYELLSFTPKQTDKFAHKWFGDRADRFMEEIERVHIGDLHGTPLLLTIAARVYLEKGTLPERRSELYGQFVDIWLNEAELHKLQAELGDKLAGPISLQKARLAHLALRMTGHPDELLLQTLSNFVAEFLQTEEQFSRIHAETYGKQFVEVMARRSGVFTRQGDVYDFIHPTFREFLAALAVVHNCGQDIERIWVHAVSHWTEPDWRGIALFTLNVLSDENVNVTSLLERILENGVEGLYFAGAALAENVNVESNLSNQTIDGLLAVAREMRWGEHEAIKLLGQLWDSQRAEDGLLKLVRDKNVNAWARREATEMLRNFGRTEQMAQASLDMASDEERVSSKRIAAVSTLEQLNRVDDLLSLANNDRIWAGVRCAAAKALGRLGYENEAVNILLRLTNNQWLSPDVRVDVAKALGVLGYSDEAIEILLKLANDQKVNEQVRIEAAEAIAHLGRTEEAVSSLSGLIHSETTEAWVRCHAAYKLADLGNKEEAVKAWQVLAQDKSNDLTRLQAIKALDLFGYTEETKQFLSELIDDNQADEGVRREATELLHKLSDNDKALT